MTNTPAPTTPYHVYAICAGSGPVVIGSYGSASDQRRAYRDALATLRDGGYDRDVARIELGSGGATDTQTVAVANPITDTNPMPSSVHEHRGSLIQKGLFQ